MANGIAPNFKDQEEKNIVLFTILISLLLGLTAYLGVVVPLVVYFGMQNKLSNAGKEIIRAYSNFQLVLLFVYIILTVTAFLFIPILIMPIVGIYGLIISILALLAIINNEEVKIPVFFEFIKESSIAPATPSAKQEAPKDELKP